MESRRGYCFEEQEANEARWEAEGNVCSKCGLPKTSEHPTDVIGRDDVCTCFCFLTTACVEVMGMADNCNELEALRKFRDDYVKLLPSGTQILKEYKVNAPKIVIGIERSGNSNQIYDYIFGIIKICVEAIEAHDDKKAFDEYAKMFKKLKKDFVD